MSPPHLQPIPLLPTPQKWRPCSYTTRGRCVVVLPSVFNITAAPQLQWAALSLPLVSFLVEFPLVLVLVFRRRSKRQDLEVKMVVFLDLDDEAVEPPDHRGPEDWLRVQRGNAGVLRGLNLDERVADGDEERGNPNKEKAITKALGCYPIITSIASHIDLNTLDALSLTCRQIRANLLQFRSQLLTSTLHCENEHIELDPAHTFRYRARAADWYFIETGFASPGGGIGKVGDCARDMVGGCRRCGRIVCRNCTIKPPAPVLLSHRHRRICKACSRVPLSSLVGPAPVTNSHELLSSSAATLSSETLQREVCTCSTAGVWLCQPCGRSLRSADTEYESIWKWRTRYLPSLGGLGVGIGEGNRGVPCGRGGECVAAREVEQEIDCDAEDAREIDSNSRAVSPSSSPGTTHVGTPGSSSSGQMGPGYERHEIEGIGGVVKKKLLRKVKVGSCVPEWGDEKDMGKFLVGEQKGTARSWCGWCWRVVPGVKDVIE